MRARVAYFVMSHSLPGQVLRLVRRLRASSPEAVVLVHHDARRVALDRDALQEAGGVLLEPWAPVDWGDYSQLEATLRGFRRLVETAEFDWMVTLSGQDYPIRPLADIERDLGSTHWDGFVETRYIPPPSLLRRDVGDFAERYFYRYYSGAGEQLVRRAAKARPIVVTRWLPSGTRIGVRALRPPFSADGLRCYQGSDWLTLSRRCVECVDAFARERPDVLRYYRRALMPTESFVQTVLGNQVSLKLSGDIRRHISWEPGAASPRALRVADLDQVLASGTDFARKFDMTVDAQVLSEIDRRVHV